MTLLAVLHRLKGVPQDPAYHPEGDVWIHTLLTLRAARRLCRERKLTAWQTYAVRWAALLHDIGKGGYDDKGDWITRRNADGRIVSPGHDTVGADTAEALLVALGMHDLTAAGIATLIRFHMRHLQPGGGKAMRRLARRLVEGDLDLESLITLIDADYAARPPRSPGDPCKALRDAAARYDLPVT